MIITTESIVLNSRKYGDSSKIVTLFTKDSGLCKVIAKGARKPKSKYGSSLEPLCHSWITYYNKSSRELQLLSKSEIIHRFSKLYRSFDHLSTGLLILESVNNTQDVNAPNPKLFDFLYNTLNCLNKLLRNPFSVFTAFQLFLAEELGFMPDFSNYGKLKSVSRYFFSLKDGLIIDSE